MRRCPRGPKPKSKYKSTGDPEACAGCSRSCAGNCGARGYQGATSRLSAERISLVGGAWDDPRRSCKVSWRRAGATSKKSLDEEVLRGAVPSAHVVRSCRPCATCPATSRGRELPSRCCSGVTVGGGRALPQVRCRWRGNRGFGRDGKQKNATKRTGRRASRNTAAKATSSQDDAVLLRY